MSHVIAITRVVDPWWVVWWGNNWGWVILFFVLFGSAIAESFREISRTHHKRKIVRIKARTQARELARLERLERRGYTVHDPVQLSSGSYVVRRIPDNSQECTHRRVVPIIPKNEDKPVGWLCTNPDCQEQLPTNYAVREEDL
jgi:hypothetical protein